MDGFLREGLIRLAHHHQLISFVGALPFLECVWRASLSRMRVVAFSGVLAATASKKNVFYAELCELRENSVILSVFAPR